MADRDPVTDGNAALIGHMVAAMSGGMIGLIIGYALAVGLIG